MKWWLVISGFLIISILLGWLVFINPATSPLVPPVNLLPTEGPVKKSIQKGLNWFSAKQSGDGGWRSETYGLMRSGQSMTPWTLYVLTQVTPEKTEELKNRITKGLVFLLDQTNPDGSVGTRDIQEYPTYSTALSLIVLTRLKPTNWQSITSRMTQYLQSRQLTEGLGWEKADSEYGGWGNATWIQKPAEPMPEIFRDLVVERVDLSHTVFVLEALHAAGRPAGDEIWSKTLVFVEKCQNDDGGFIFAPNSILGNKAGRVGKDTNGVLRYRSYGSMTADGVQALLFCGFPPDHPRIKAGLEWLTANFQIDQCPGFTNEPQPPWAEGVIFYYYWSLSRLFNELKVSSIETKDGRINWAEKIATRLIQSQKPDGSWVNPVGLMKENDPLIATGFALMTLDYCLKYTR